VSTTVSSIIINATANDAAATVSGAGTKALDYGDNTFEVVVTAEDGITTKTYTIVVTREDSRKATPFTEDFESTTSGWFVANGTQTNKWIWGTATAASGSRSVYISNNNGTSNGYSLSNRSVTHLYCDVVFTPSSTDYQLSFDWKGMGEIYSGTLCDYMNAYLVEPSLIPVAGTALTATSLGNYRGSDTWQHATLTLSATSYSGTTKRLVFTWGNDDSAGTQPPAAIDNVSISSTETGIDDIGAETIHIYPNPVRDWLMIEHAAAKHVQIYTVDGQKIYDNPNRSDKEIIPVTAWKTGLYIVKIRTDKGEVLIEKIIKE
jgi:hypothetical protein